MSGAIIVLCLAWTLGTLVSKYLKIGDFIAGIIKNNLQILFLVPIMLFLLSAVMYVSTGSSWGTFAILIPVAFPVLHSQGNYRLLLVSLGAILSGAAFGDNTSPISDTSIMAATAAGCDSLTHFRTQLPYVLINASIAAVLFCVVR